MSDSNTNTETLISAVDLDTSYTSKTKAVEVLAGANLEVYSGEILGIVGASGSGKSTLLNLIAGIDKPDSGELRIAGEDISRLSESGLADWRAASQILTISELFDKVVADIGAYHQLFTPAIPPFTGLMLSR